MKILITGVEGFVGQHLARELVDAGHRVIGSYLHQPPPFEAAPLDAVELVELDLGDTVAVERVVGADGDDGRAFDRVVHLAGRSHVGRSWQDLSGYFQANVLCTEFLMDALPKSCRLVFSSSAEVYGVVPESELPIDEQRMVAPTTPYGMTKAAAERLVLQRGAIVARNFNLIGPGQAPNFAFPNFALQLAAIARQEQEPVLSVGNLTARRDFVNIRDGVRALRLLTEKGIPGQVYNVASGKARSIQDLLDTLCKLSGVTARQQQDPARMRPSDNPIVCGSSVRLEALGWQRQETVEGALDALWKWARGQKP